MKLSLFDHTTRQFKDLLLKVTLASTLTHQAPSEARAKFLQRIFVKSCFTLRLKAHERQTLWCLIGAQLNSIRAAQGKPLQEFQRPHPTRPNLSSSQLVRLMERFYEVFEYQFSELLKLIPKQAEFSPEETCDLMNMIFRHTRCLGTEFRAVIDEEATAIGNDQERKLLILPRHLPAGRYDYIIVISRVFGHEFCGHIYRRITREHGELWFLGYGLPGYEDFEEGLAELIEQTILYKVAPDQHQQILAAQANISTNLARVQHYVNDYLRNGGDYNGYKAEHDHLQNLLLSTLLWHSGKIDCANRKHVQLAQSFIWAPEANMHRVGIVM